MLLRAAECENEVNGPTQQAIDWINEVRNRADLSDLELSDFDTTDQLFEQIANIERPKEFGWRIRSRFRPHPLGLLLRQQPFETAQGTRYGTPLYSGSKESCELQRCSKRIPELKSTFDTYISGHEFLPIVQQLMNNNPNLKGNSANYSTDNSTYFRESGCKVRPVVNLSK